MFHILTFFYSYRMKLFSVENTYDMSHFILKFAFNNS